MTETRGYAAPGRGEALRPFRFERREPGDNDVRIEIAFCGICRVLAGSLIGGLPETQEMLDFCAKENVLADVEVVAMKDVNAAYDRMVKSDVRYRFSIDLKTL